MKRYKLVLSILMLVAAATNIVSAIINFTSKDGIISGISKICAAFMNDFIITIGKFK